MGDLGPCGKEAGQIQFQPRNPLADAERLRYLGMDFADGADGVTPDGQRCRARRVQASGYERLIHSRTKTHRRHEFTPQRHRRSRVLTGERDGERFVLVGQLTTSVARRENMADLEQRHAEAAMRFVERDRLQHAGPHRRPEQILADDQWIGDPDRIARQSGGDQLAAAEERVGDGFVEAVTEQNLAQSPAPLLAWAQPAVHRRVGDDLAEVGVAVVAGDFFDDVDLGCTVGSPGRQVDRERIAGAADHRESDRIEQRRDRVGVEGRTEDPVDLTDTCRHRANLVGHRLVAGIDCTVVHHEVGARLAEQFDEAPLGERHPVRIDAPLETARGLRADPDPVHRARHRSLFEQSGLQRNDRRGVGDLAVETAHHSTDPDRDVICVADEEIVGRERTDGAIESGDRLALASEPDPESSAAERLEIVGMVRLIQFEHHVVADVDDVVDRTHPGCAQTAGHPIR